MSLLQSKAPEVARPLVAYFNEV